jgi:hypothetical protein
MGFEMTRPAVLRIVAGFLRKGYPRTAPARGYAPVLALLGCHLTDEEVFELACVLLRAEKDPGDSATIRLHVERVSSENASEGDVRRVQTQLRQLTEALPVSTRQHRSAV